MTVIVTKSLSTDFPNGYNFDNLKKAVDASTVITATLFHGPVFGDVINFVWDRALTGPEDSEFTSIISDHNPTPPADLSSPVRDYFADISLGKISGEASYPMFGYNPDIDSGADETIWSASGIFSLPTGAETLDLVSTNAADTAAGTGARKVKITGLDANYKIIQETVTMNGLTPVTSTSSFLRMYYATVEEVGTGGINAGDITITQTTSSKVMGLIPLNDGCAFQSMFTVPQGKKGLIHNIMYAVNKSKDATLIIKRKLFGKPLLTIGRIPGFEGISIKPFKPPLVFTEKTDVIFEADGVTTSNNIVALSYSMQLVDN